VVLLPTHKSFLDLWLLSFIHQETGTEMPFVCGDTQLFQLAFLSTFIKNNGGFKLDEKNMKSDLFKACVDGYVYALMKNNQLIELYLEQRRSRSGKIQSTNEPLFDHIVNVYFNTEGNVKKDIMFVPVTINYDRVVEADSFPLDLLGETNKRESAFKILKQLAFTKKQLGKVIVRYG
jgi:glycerol-3-phosphate O-acyltransferase